LVFAAPICASLALPTGAEIISFSMEAGLPVLLLQATIWKRIRDEFKKHRSLMMGCIVLMIP
jgi:hypothetical protein